MASISRECPHRSQATLVAFLVFIMLVASLSAGLNGDWDMDKGKTQLTPEILRSGGNDGNHTLVLGFDTEFRSNLNSTILDSSTSVEASGELDGFSFSGTGKVKNGTVATGRYHSCAILEIGEMRCWGRNNEDQIGDGGGGSRTRPTKVDLPTGITAIEAEAGNNHNCVILQNFYLQCWGDNEFGQIGDNTTTDRSSLTNVSFPNGHYAVAVSAGESHTCAIIDNGTVWCWGLNENGQLGDGTNANRTTPTNVSLNQTATAITTGNAHTCVILDDGKIQCWGSNSNGQLGINTSDLNQPLENVTLPNGSKAIALGSGYTHTCAIVDNGSIYCWGHNSFGQLGDGTTGPQSTVGGESTPVRVNMSMQGNISAFDISAGDDHSCAIFHDGSVKCWGRNNYGQIGNGASQSSPMPTNASLPTGRNATDLEVGRYHTCAILDDGSMRCWGRNRYGEIGDGTSGRNTVRRTPTNVTRLNEDPGLWKGTPTKLTGGISLTIWANNTTTGGAFSHMDHVNVSVVKALDYNGSSISLLSSANISIHPTLHCSWCTLSVSPSLPLGLKMNATGSITGALVNTAVSFKNNYSILAEGSNGSDDVVVQLIFTSPTPPIKHTLVRGFEHQIGTALNTSLQQDPTSVEASGMVPGLSFTAKGGIGNGTLLPNNTIAAGSEHTCVIVKDGSLRCWGRNSAGQLGDNTTQNRMEPTTTMLPTGRTAIAVSAGFYQHTCAILDDGSLWCWGQNNAGQLGDGSTTSHNKPTRVNLPTNRTAIDISAGDSHTCAILDDGSIRCWGYNGNGQLGIGSSTSFVTNPANVALPTNRSAVAISSGISHTCAILDNGTILCWGLNEYGQLGDGNNIDQNSPISVNMYSNGTYNALHIASGGSHTCAILNNGSVLCWGSNVYGQIGDGTTTTGFTNRTTATKTDLPSGRTGVSITTGEDHTCAILDNEELMCWGRNGAGQLGEGSYSNQKLPKHTNLPLGRAGLSIMSGMSHTCSILADGTMRCWGGNLYGQIGDNTTYNHFDPAKVLKIPLIAGNASGLWIGRPSVTTTNLILTVWANDSTVMSSYYAKVNVSVIQGLEYDPAEIDISVSANISINPVLLCSWCSVSATPPLPKGFALNTTDGSISGNLSNLMISFNNTYNITASSANGSDSIFLKLKYVSSQSPTPITIARGFEYTIAIPLDNSMRENASIIEASGTLLGLNFTGNAWNGTPSEFSNGTVLTVWGNNTTSEIFVYGSLNISVISAATYDRYSINASRNQTITPLTPTILTHWGETYNFTITPPLPEGLSLDNKTGTISGTPTIPKSGHTYTINVSNGFGWDTIIVNISVSEIAPSITASATSINLGSGAPIAPIFFINSGGPATIWSITPDLSKGLTFDPSTGTIQGTPTAISSAVTYTINATNDVGYNVTTVTIEIFLDTDIDGVPDIDDIDDDGDSWPDDVETPCGSDPLNSSDYPTDTDSDGICDPRDPDKDGDQWDDLLEIDCNTDPLISTDTPEDTDGDKTCNHLDPDDDNDGALDDADAFPLNASEDTDTDADGLGNNIDTDDDGDKWADEIEKNCDSDPLDALSQPIDTDQDLSCDLVDEDDDEDGFLDVVDDFPLDRGEQKDTDNDGIGNVADEDDDGDGWSDEQEELCNTDPLNKLMIPNDRDGDKICDLLDKEDANVDSTLTENNANSSMNQTLQDNSAVNESGTYSGVGEKSSNSAMSMFLVILGIGIFGAIASLFFFRSRRGKNVEEWQEKAEHELQQTKSDFTDHDTELTDEIMVQGSTEFSATNEYSEDYAQMPIEGQIHPPLQSDQWPNRNLVGEYDYEGWEWLEFPQGSAIWYYRDPATGEWYLQG